MQRDDGGGWEFDASGVLPAFEPERRSGAATDINETDGDIDDSADTQTIVTANGVCAYNYDWNDIENGAANARCGAAPSPSAPTDWHLAVVVHAVAFGCCVAAGPSLRPQHLTHRSTSWAGTCVTSLG